MQRPEFIKHYSEIQQEDNFHYPDSNELLSIGSAFGSKMGLKKLGVHHELLLPGRRTSYPHAESEEEEFVYVIEGNPHVWIDGNLHELKPGDGVGFPAGTGICHTFINNSSEEVRLLVVGETNKESNRVYYPLNPERKPQIPEYWWEDVPKHALGPHDGIPDALRK